ncbi:uncharacterized protein BDW43DRAFT_121852 [Aspergillus alliaceus]|uniref:uncharacterized protein n=1 Tax=Petromyces alliaceus TaxID=209559 RepID=UPI0012A5EC17|nr:uncharacterized protein BDW43DRAFT_121852 [Aspergillus alliaceus]KAB8238687.1 hypothetical protein BDW43DRAFT_121852 [Aspergillus alliaceus]
MNRIFERLFSLFSMKGPPTASPSPPPAGLERTPSQSPSTELEPVSVVAYPPAGRERTPSESLRMGPKPVSVVVSPPAFDLEPYESFDEDFLQRTVDEILSDQASFENSFDEYSGDRMMDGSCDKRGSIGANSRVGGSECNRSPYFPSKVAGMRFVAHRVIRKMESTDEESEEEEEEEDDDIEGWEADRFYGGQSGSKLKRRDELDRTAAAKIKLEHLPEDEIRVEELGTAVPASTVVSVDDNACDDGDLEEVSEEKYVFASVGDEEHDRLVNFLAEHPFMCAGAYPVKRSARRSFIKDVRREASISGMDEGALNVLLKWVKKTYLEVLDVPNVDKEGSDFGDEIDDENLVDVQPPKASKKERKRKRAGVEHTREKAPGKKRKSLMRDSHDSMTPTEHNARITIDVDSGDSAIVNSNSPSPDIQVLEKAPVFQTGPQRTLTAVLDKSEDTQTHRARADKVAATRPATPSKERRNERSTPTKTSSLSKLSRSHGDCISNNSMGSQMGKLRVSQGLSSQADPPRKHDFLFAAKPPTSKLEVPKSPKIPHDDNESRKKEAKHRKRQRRRERRKSKQSETMSGIGQPSGKDQQNSHTASPVSHEKPVVNTPVVHNKMFLEDPFWDMDF